MYITRNYSTQHEVTRLNPKDLILHYSKKILSEEEIEALSHGLKFGLPPKSINYSRWFLAFKKLFLKLKHCNFLAESNDDFNYFKTSLKTIAYKTYYSFSLEKFCNQRSLHMNQTYISTEQFEISSTKCHKMYLKLFSIAALRQIHISMAR